MSTKKTTSPQKITIGMFVFEIPAPTKDDQVVIDVGTDIKMGVYPKYKQFTDDLI